MPFNFTPVPGFHGLTLVSYDRRADERGWFQESYKRSAFDAAGLPAFVQSNHSASARGVVRGLHYQLPPHAQGKLVRCVRGSLFDVVLDLRQTQPSFGSTYTLRLAADEPRSLYVPPGFAHGFQALADDTQMEYLVTAEYDAPSERAIRHDDPALAIRWPLPPVAVAAKDLAAPLLANAEIPGDWT